jgi:hypothetical protein
MLLYAHAVYYTNYVLEKHCHNPTFQKIDDLLFSTTVNIFTVT